MGITDTTLLEVMRAQDPEKLKRYVEKAREKLFRATGAGKELGVGAGNKIGRASRQYSHFAKKQLANTLRVDRSKQIDDLTKSVSDMTASMKQGEELLAQARQSHEKLRSRLNPPPRPGLSLGKRVGLGVGAAALGYGAYRGVKALRARIRKQHFEKKAAQSKAQESTSVCFNRMLRESGINADHVKLGLDVMKATGLDQAMAKQMSDGNQRKQAWKYGTRAAAVSLAAPAIGTLGFHAALMAGQIPEARKMGVRGIGNTLRKAYELHANHANPPAEIARQVAQFTFSKPWLGTVGGIGAAGGVYGLMKKAPTPAKVSMLTPKKQYKYIRKDNDKYIYPKKVR